MLQRTGGDSADGHLDVLGAVPPVYRKAVLDQCERRTARKGDFIWRQGEPADYIAFIVSGKAMSSYQSRNGKTGTTGFWCPGDMLGAADIATPGMRQQTVRCLQDCVIQTLSFERLDDLVRRFPEVAQAIIRALSARLRWVAHLAVMLETQSAQARICAVLLSLSERFSAPSDDGVLIDLQLTNDDLAAIAGVSRQFANTTLHDLKKRGLLASAGRRLVLKDPKALEDLMHRL